MRKLFWHAACCAAAAIELAFQQTCFLADCLHVQVSHCLLHARVSTALSYSTLLTGWRGCPTHQQGYQLLWLLAFLCGLLHGCTPQHQRSLLMVAQHGPLQLVAHGLHLVPARGSALQEVTQRLSCTACLGSCASCRKQSMQQPGTPALLACWFCSCPSRSACPRSPGSQQEAASQTLTGQLRLVLLQQPRQQQLQRRLQQQPLQELYPHRMQKARAASRALLLQAARCPAAPAQVAGQGRQSQAAVQLQQLLQHCLRRSRAARSLHVPCSQSGTRLSALTGGRQRLMCTACLHLLQQQTAVQGRAWGTTATFWTRCRPRGRVCQSCSMPCWNRSAAQAPQLFQDGEVPCSLLQL